MNLVPQRTDTARLFVRSAADVEELARRIYVMLTAAYAPRTRIGPGPVADFAAFAAELEQRDCLPEQGLSFSECILELRSVIEGCVNVNHPHAAAHLHCPPLTDAVAAEVIAALVNPSLDSYDQSGTATIVEEHLVRRFVRECFGDTAAGDGVFTSGGTQSNLMGLLLAREVQVRRHSGRSVLRDGLPADHHRFRFLCSENAHFSIGKAAMLLGLGENAVTKIRCDANGRMSLDDLQRVFNDLFARRLVPLALCATAGTTDHGSIDDLPALADFCERNELWFHVDAAYGGPLLFTKHRVRLHGIERAHSAALDFHKMMFQPIACGTFLVRRAEDLAVMRRHADYLNRVDDTEPNLVEKSLATTRRFDALKLFISLRTMGRTNFEACVDRLLDLAQHAADRLRAHPDFELLAEPQLSTVLFRLRKTAGTAGNDIHTQVRRHLLRERSAVIAETRCNGRRALKFTFMNPTATSEDVDALIQRTAEAARSLETLS